MIQSDIIHEINTMEFQSILFLNGWDNYPFDLLGKIVDMGDLVANALFHERVRGTFQTIQFDDSSDYVRTLKALRLLPYGEKFLEVNHLKMLKPEVQSCVVTGEAVAICGAKLPNCVVVVTKGERGEAVITTVETSCGSEASLFDSAQAGIDMVVAEKSSK
jgi:hypothetical protein